jgi:hypothetical protein
MVARALVDCERTGIRRNAEFAGVAAGAVAASSPNSRADNFAVGEHVEIVIIPFAGWPRARGALLLSGHRSPVAPFGDV